MVIMLVFKNFRQGTLGNAVLAPSQFGSFRLKDFEVRRRWHAPRTCEGLTSRSVRSDCAIGISGTALAMQ